MALLPNRIRHLPERIWKFYRGRGRRRRSRPVIILLMLATLVGIAGVLLGIGIATGHLVERAVPHQVDDLDDPDEK